MLARKAEAAAKLGLARLNYDRQKELFQKKVGSKQELDQAQNTFQVTQSTVDSMQFAFIIMPPSILTNCLEDSYIEFVILMRVS